MKALRTLMGTPNIYCRRLNSATRARPSLASKAVSRAYGTGEVTAVSQCGYGSCSESVDVRILRAYVAVLHAQSITYMVEQAR